MCRLSIPIFMIINAKRVPAVIAAALAVVFCGCSARKTDVSGGVSGVYETSETSDIYGVSKQYWRSAAYTMEEINEKLHPTLYNSERDIKPDDVSGGALRAYNAMLGYAERILGTEYYVYDYYYADWTETRSWVIKLIPYEMAETAESEGRGLYAGEPVTMIFDEDGGEINSQLEPYYMERKWFAELKREMSESFPEYRLELNVSVFEGLYPNVLEERFDDFSDYTYVINDGFYDKADEWEYGNIISVELSRDINGEERLSAADVFERIKPLLTRYCVTEVNILTLSEDGDIDEAESFTIN